MIVLVLAATVVAVGARVPAAAHTGVLRASPGPGEEVAGPVTSVDLTFLDPVEPDVSIEVRDPSGEPVAGVSAVERSADGRRARVTFTALSGAGEYVVEYRFTAEDGDASRETYRFTLLPAEPDGDGSDTGTVLGVVGGGSVLLAGLVVALRRRRRTG